MVSRTSLPRQPQQHRKRVVVLNAQGVDRSLRIVDSQIARIKSLAKNFKKDYLYCSCAFMSFNSAQAYALRETLNKSKQTYCSGRLTSAQVGRAASQFDQSNTAIENLAAGRVCALHRANAVSPPAQRGPNRPKRTESLKQIVYM